jgi:cytochrome c-type biogenesis protein CcmH/NrfG
MSKRTRTAPARERIYDADPPQRYTWMVYGVGMMLVGSLAGYVLSTTVAPGRSTQGAQLSAPASVSTAPAAMVDEQSLKTYRDILAKDPGNFQAAVNAGNILYDGKRYGESVPYYQQAMRIKGDDVNVSTDLGTALWYSGKPDEALAQYEVSLRLSPDHAQTLFNVGIVRSDGEGDFRGAVQAWETLLRTNPAYPNAASVRTLITEARAKTGSAN